MVDSGVAIRIFTGQEAVDAHNVNNINVAVNTTANVVDTSTDEGLSRIVDVLPAEQHFGA